MFAGGILIVLLRFTGERLPDLQRWLGLSLAAFLMVVLGNAGQMLSGGLMLLVVAAARGEFRDLTFTPRSLAAEAYLAAVGSLAGYSAYIYALKYLPVSVVSLYAYANPVIAVLLGTVLLAEPFGPRVIVATGTVLLGITVVRSGGGKS